jgi:hypothetical protein
MVPGVHGSLLAGAFLEGVVLPEIGRGPHAPSRADHLRLQRWWRRVEATLGPAVSIRTVLDVAALPLVELLGYDVLHIEPIGDGFAGVLGWRGTPVAALMTTRWGADAGAAWRDLVRAGRAVDVGWGLICTGRALRLIDASRTWARRAVEFTFADVLADQRAATLLAGLCRADALAGPPRAESSLERFVERSDAHGLAVCASLGDGVLEALTGLVNALDDRRARSGRWRPPTDTFEQALTIVYRLLFLLFAEARALVPTWHQLYREAYTIDALCRRTVRRPDAAGLWAALQAISRLAHTGCRVGDLVVTAFNGRLFSPRHTPLGESALADRSVGHAVVSLATRPSPRGREFVSYADLDVEQLGAVYERVLDYEPARDEGPTRDGGPLVLARTSTERKSTGSFYTPRAITEFLVRRTLHPLVAGRSAEDILALRVVDPAMGSGAFLVAACRYLGDAAAAALERDRGGLTDAERLEQRTHLRRAVAERCLYGVDLNPMAVQLARLSLWLTTLAADRPLTFLDHHLAVGDSLLGASLSDLGRQRPGPGRRRRDAADRPLPLFDDRVDVEMATTVLPDRFRLACEPSASVEAVHDKERTLAALAAAGGPLARWKAAADLWCAGWFAGPALPTGLYEDVLSGVLTGRSALAERLRRTVLDDAAAAARREHFFHWELEFPEVFHDAAGRRDPHGGFDAVIGNPPWDALRADTGDGAARERARAGREARLRFIREAGLYRLQGAGHVNRYQLFLERALQLARPHGRVGLILPSGLATDAGSAGLRRALLDETRVERLHGFDNRAGIFPIHRDTKFLLVTAVTAERTERVTCVFGVTDAAWLDTLPDAAANDPAAARRIVLTRSQIDAGDPDHLTLPLLTSPIDQHILAQVVSHAPRLGDADGWAVRFGRELNATEDRRHFVATRGSAAAHPRAALVVIDGRHLTPFRIVPDRDGRIIPRRVAAALLDADLTFRRARLAYRDVASASNRVTLIAAILPAGCVSTHTVFCLKTVLGGTSQYCLLALLNSLVANYLVRLQVTTHVTTTLMARLPVPRPVGGSIAFRELATLARSLEKTGVDGNIPAFVRLNAIAAGLYGLTPEQYEHVVQSFPLLPAALRQDCIRSFQCSHRGTETQR